MRKTIEANTQLRQSRFLWFLILSYVMVLMLTNWFDPRLVRVGPFTTDAGTLIFPLSFLLSDLITEVYGYKVTRRAIWVGFLFNIIFIAYGQLVTHLPNPTYPTHNAAFDALFVMNFRIIIASVISYFCSEPLSAMVVAKLKVYTQGRYMWLRFVCSTVSAAAADSAIFGVIAFYGIISHVHLLALIVTMWGIKVVIEVCGLPVSIRLAHKLKTCEGLDIFDTNTRFTLLSLDDHYRAQDNHYHGAD